jgi:hypothetical protein
LQGQSRSLGSKFERHRYCAYPSAALSRFGEACKAARRQFLQQSLRNASEGEGATGRKTKEPHPRKQQQSFSSFSSTSSLSTTQPQPHNKTPPICLSTRWDSLLFEQAAATRAPGCVHSRARIAMPLQPTQQLLEPLSPELTRPLGCYHRRRDDLGLLRPQAHRQRHLRGRLCPYHHWW